MLLRKLRLEKGWSQETLAEVSGLSVRTVQRIERGGTASLESLSALASVLEVDRATLAREMQMYKQKNLATDEQEAIEHVRDIKGFYSHLAVYVVSIVVMAIANLSSGTQTLWFIWPLLGWGLGVAAHGLSVFEVLSLFSAEWENRQVKKRLQRSRH
ncbi:MAG: 2TM domain-containing protein [Rhodospirillales bacterium]